MTSFFNAWTRALTAKALRKKKQKQLRRLSFLEETYSVKGNVQFKKKMPNNIFPYVIRDIRHVNRDFKHDATPALGNIASTHCSIWRSSLPYPLLPPWPLLPPQHSGRRGEGGRGARGCSGVDKTAFIARFTGKIMWRQHEQPECVQHLLSRGLSRWWTRSRIQGRTFSYTFVSLRNKSGT